MGRQVVASTRGREWEVAEAGGKSGRWDLGLLGGVDARLRLKTLPLVGFLQLPAAEQSARTHTHAQT